MKVQSFRQNLGFFIGIAVLSVLVSASTFAEEGVTVSGRVVNEVGDPVVGISIAIQPYKIMGNKRIGGWVGIWQRETGLEGRFSISHITPAESVRFAVEDEQTETQILSIQIGELTLYPNNHPHFREMPFSLAAGMNIEDAVITVKTNIRPQVRARVIFADRTPVTNAQIRTHILHRDLDGSGSGYSGSTAQTDADGYFVQDLKDDDPHFYVVGVEHQGLLAKAQPFIFHEGQPQVHLLLTLNGNPVPPAERPPEPPLFEAFLNPPTVWIVNPANGHAYKKIYCQSVEDAMNQAAAEGAYLVSINDKAENAWLQGIFDRDSFWIGLTDLIEEGRWQWHSGEPVTYTNWKEHEKEGGNTEMKDYVITGFLGRWTAVAPGPGGGADFIKVAILEKASLTVETPPKDN